MNRDLRYTEVRDIVYYPTKDSDDDKYSLDLFIPSERELCNVCVTSDVKRTTSNLYPRESSSFSEHEHCKTRELQRQTPPIVLFVHGGGWQRGGRLAWVNFMRTPNLLLALVTWYMNLYRNVGEALASRGVACAVISYPLVELPMPWTLLDILVSYCCSLLVSGSVYLLVRVLVSGSVYCLSVNWPQSWENPNNIDVLTFNNIVVSLAVLFSSRRFIFSQYQVCFLIVVSLVVIVPILELKNYLSYLAFLVTLIIYLSLVATYRMKEPVSHKKQIKAVTKATKWIKHFGRNNTYYDHTALFLMGHSAGGHLVALSTLDKQHLNEVGCSATDIKGVMCISGVYDLLTLASPMSRRLYLQPTFGHQANWESASPLRTINRADDTLCSPSFLIINAQFDGFFKAEGENFYNELKKKNFEVVRKSVKRTTHFTIMSQFSTSLDSAISSICVDFVEDNFRRTYGLNKNTVSR